MLEEFVIYLGIGLMQIGYFSGYGYSAYQSMASMEFYLRALNQTEIAAAMKRSITLPSNPNCTND